jgi:DNA mismatch repair protein MSH4
MTMMYKISSGPIQEEHYGLSFAKVIGFPEQFMRVAETVSKALKEQTDEKKQTSQSRMLIRRRKLILNLHDTLKQLSNSDMDDEALGSYMRRLQTEFVERMDEIENGAAHGAEDETGPGADIAEDLIGIESNVYEDESEMGNDIEGTGALF